MGLGRATVAGVLRLDSTSDFDAKTYTLAATLDTEPLARSYGGGVHTRLSSNHFQSARPTFGYATFIQRASLRSRILGAFDLQH